MNPSSTPILRSVFWRIWAWATLILFATAQVSHALPITQVLRQEQAQPLQSSRSQQEHAVSFPGSIGFIEETFHSQTSKHTVFLMQDPHTNASGQIHISKILKFLIDQHPKIRYVFLEAGSGDESLHFLKPMAPIEERKQVGMAFLHKGKLQGSEYFNLVEDHDITLWGVENLGLYHDSWKKYGEVVKGRKNLFSYLENIHITVRTLKPKIYSHDLLRFDRAFEQYLKGAMPFIDYMEELLHQARAVGIDVDVFSQLASLEELKAVENEINFEKAQQEQVDAIDLLPEKDKISLSRLIRNNSFPKRYQHQERHFEAIYMVLKDTFKREGVSLNRFPNLVKYMDYLIQARQMNAPSVLKEQNQLEQRVFETLTVTQNERDLHRADEGIRLLKKAANLAMTPSEFDRFNRLKSRFNIPAITGSLNEMIMNLKSHYERVIFLKESCDTILKSAIDFYKLTYQRDIALVDNMLNKMTQDHQEMSILITGGYHAHHLKEILHKRDISFVSIVPQVLHETDHKRYEKLLLNLNPIDIFNGRTLLQSSILTTAPLGSTLMLPRTSFIDLPRVWVRSAPHLSGLKRAPVTDKVSGTRNMKPEKKFVTREEIEDIVALLSRDRDKAVQQMITLRRDGKLTRFQEALIKNGLADQLFMGKYIFLDEISKRGGMSDVYKAYDPEQDLECAIKVMKPDMIKRDGAERRFENEITNTLHVNSKGSHRNVIQAYDAGEYEGSPFLVIQYVYGYDLRFIVNEYGPLPLDYAVKLIIDSAKGLGHVHGAGMIHRDVKPGNILLETAKNRVKISDFGLSIIGDERKMETQTDLSLHLGTPSFMSPEQVQDAHSVTQRTDIYSLGASLYFLVTGEDPYEGSNALSTMKSIVGGDPIDLKGKIPELPETLEVVFNRMVAKDEQDRYANMADVIEALEALDLPEGLTFDRVKDKPETSLGYLLSSVQGTKMAATTLKSTLLEFESPDEDSKQHKGSSGSRNILPFLNELTRNASTLDQSHLMVGDSRLRLEQVGMGYKVYGFPRASGTRIERLGMEFDKDFIQYRHAPNDRLHIRIGQTRVEGADGVVSYRGGIHLMILFDTLKNDYYIRMKYWDPDMGSGGEFVNHDRKLYFSDSSLGGVVPLGRVGVGGPNSIFVGNVVLDFSDPSSFRSSSSIEALMKSLRITSKAHSVIFKIGDTFAILHRSNTDALHVTEVEPEGDIRIVEQNEPEHLTALLSSIQILSDHMSARDFQPGEERTVNLYTNDQGSIVRVEPYHANDAEAVYALLYQAPYSNAEKPLIAIVPDGVIPAEFDVDQYYLQHPGLAEHVKFLNDLERDQRRRLTRQPSPMMTAPSHATSHTSSTGHFVTFPSFPEIGLEETILYSLRALSDHNLHLLTELINSVLGNRKDEELTYRFTCWVSKRGAIAAVGIVDNEERRYVYVSPHPHSMTEDSMSTVHLATWIGNQGEGLTAVAFNYDPNGSLETNLTFERGSLTPSQNYMRDVLTLALMQRALGVPPTQWDENQLIASNARMLQPSHREAAGFQPAEVEIDAVHQLDEIEFLIRAAVDRHGLIWAIGDKDGWTHFAQNPTTNQPFTVDEIVIWKNVQSPHVTSVDFIEDSWSAQSTMKIVRGQRLEEFSSIMVENLKQTLRHYPFRQFNGGSRSSLGTKVESDGNYFYFEPVHRKQGMDRASFTETGMSAQINALGSFEEMLRINRGLNAVGLIGPHSRLFFDLSGLERTNLQQSLNVLMANRQMLRRRGGDLVVGSLDVPHKEILLARARKAGLPVVDSYVTLNGFTLILSRRHLVRSMPLPDKALGIVFYDPSFIRGGILNHTHTGHLIAGALGIGDLSQQLRSNPQARLHPRVNRLWRRNTGQSERDIRSAAHHLAQAESTITKKLIWAAKIFRLPLMASPLKGLQRYFKGLIEATIFA
jgi:serine/threonine protein kinase